MVNNLDASLNAIQSHFTRLNTGAKNIANLNTDSYKREPVTINKSPTGTTMLQYLLLPAQAVKPMSNKPISNHFRAIFLPVFLPFSLDKKIK